MNYLTAKQIGSILGMSYPTALKFAHEHGEQMVDEQRQPWAVPVEIVTAELNRQQKDLNQRREQLDKYTNGASTPAGD